MLAITINSHGNQPLELVELPRPECGADQVLVKVGAAALNHLDLFVHQGWPGLKLSFPHVVGSDAGGVIVAIGKKAKRSLARGLKVGSAVVLNSGISCGTCEFCRARQRELCVKLQIFGEQRPGTFAEYLLTPAAQLWPLPKHLSITEGGAFGLTFVTAWRMLKSLAQLQRGEKLLIQGIGGGVATAALLLAKKMGAEVWVSSRDPQKLANAKKMGASQCLPFSENLATQIRELTGKRGVDVVLDSVGRLSWPQSLMSLKRGGRLVTCGATTGPQAVTDINRLFWNQLTIFGSTMGSLEEFEQMHRFVCRHKIKPCIDSVYPASQVNEAYARLESQKQVGKIVLQF